MAEREPVIVIKKITVTQAGGHGGSWKVAFADFMTAMMAFFLVMWLLGQSDETKKNVSDYFSTPSVIEYNFSNFGVQLTLEKLFLDLLNEPLKVLQDFVTPADMTPNVLTMGTDKMAQHYIADKLGDKAEKVDIQTNEFQFEISDHHIFALGSAAFVSGAVDVLGQLNEIIGGTEDSNIYVDILLPEAQVPGSRTRAVNVGEERLDLMLKEVSKRIESDSTSLYGKLEITGPRKQSKGIPKGKIRVRVEEKTKLGDREAKTKLRDFGDKDESLSLYDNFVNQLTNSRKPASTKQ